MTPDWVKDACFYHVLSDRLARSGRVGVTGSLAGSGSLVVNVPARSGRVFTA